MYREALRACPACTSPMQEVRLVFGAAEHAAIDVCGPCGAGYFDYFAGELATLARALLGREPAPPPSPPSVFVRPPLCPDCDDELALLPYLDEGPLLYRCDSCLAAFATARQLRLLAEFEQTRKASIQVLRAVAERLGMI